MDLRIKVPKKYKKQLMARFNYWKKSSNKNLDVNYINTECPLCLEFQMEDCRDCPFEVISEKLKGIHKGCVKWMVSIIPSKLFFVENNCLYWEKSDDAKAKEQLKKLRKVAKELIEWI